MLEVLLDPDAPALAAEAQFEAPAQGQPSSTSTASAKAAIDGNAQSGVTGACGSGVAPQPGRRCRRLIQTVGRPAALAGTWSWN